MSDNKNWAAWINMMPTGSPTLHVTGVLDMGSESDSADIVFAGLAKRSPPILLLNVIPKTIFIPREPGDTEIRLHYTQQAIDGQFHSIVIRLPDGSNITIKDIQLVF